ncbi:MAG: hypothetical protein WC722_11015 [Rhodospirillales bacterium]|jgi:hypothetical protein
MVNGHFDFSYCALEDFLRRLAGLGDIFPFESWQGQPGILLRHDLDLELEPALRIAEIENRLGLRATFFVMTTAGTYNPSSPAGRRFIRAIQEAGGEIGLHFDPSLYGASDLKRLAACARQEADLLADIAGRDIVSISLHNPSIAGEYPLFEGWRNAYDPRCFSKDRYLSDSRMRVAADPLAFFAGACEATYQLLLHPLHYSATGDGYPAPMITFLKRMAQEVAATFGVNSAFAASVEGGFLGKVAKAARDWRED